MKLTLVLCLALCVSVGCRHDTTRDYRDLPEEVTLRDWTNLDTVDAAPLTLESLCAYLGEYEAECANRFAWEVRYDSTGLDWLPAKDVRRYSTHAEVRVRAPSTPDLPGFMAFIKRRVRR